MKQLVLSGNRVIAHGEDCFLSMGGTVICPDSGRVYQNATVANVEGAIPADIDEVGYEYHAGEFVPCAPYGKDESGNGTLLVACAECGTPRDSGIPVKNIPNVLENGLTLSYLPNIEMPENAYTDIAYGNGIFVAVRDAVSGAYSKGGDVWETISFPAAMYGITYGDGKFVAVGVRSAAYSTDGVTWTAVSLPSSFGRGTDVAYGGGRFVAINGDDATAYSTDGITWTSGGRSADGSNANNRRVAYGAGKFVVISYRISSFRPSSYIYYSADGITWTAGVFSEEFSDLTYGEGLFVGITNNGKIHYTTGPEASGVDAATLSSATWRVIDYNKGVFVAISDGTAAAYSTDGINWTEITLPEDNDLVAIAHSEERFIAVGGKKALTSEDGKIWPFRGVYRFRLPNGEDVTDTVKAVLGV